MSIPIDLLTYSMRLMSTLERILSMITENSPNFDEQSFLAAQRIETI